MIQFSIPTVLSVFAASSAVAVTSVAVAVPAITHSEAPKIVATATATPTPTMSSTPVAKVNGDSPLAAYPDHVLMGGIHLHDLPMGFTVNVIPGGVFFSYVGECIGDRTIITIWGNNGLWKSRGGGYCQTIAPGQMTHSGAGLTWNEDIRNAYCNSPQGGATAYRAEIYGMYTEWVPIPEEYKQCPNGRAPQGPPAPTESVTVAPTVPPTPVEPAPAPSPSDSSSPSPSASATP